MIVDRKIFPRREFIKGAAATSLCLLPSVVTAADDVIAETQYGKLKGTRIADSCVFKGVPYAQVTKRLTPAVAFEPWAGIRDALEFGPRAWQAGSASGEMSEN